RSVPKSDRALWVVELPGCEPLRFRLGAGRDPIANDPSVRVEHLSGVNLTVRSVTAIALPAARWGRKSFRAGDKIQLKSIFCTHGQSYRMDWSGSFTLAK